MLHQPGRTGRTTDVDRRIVVVRMVRQVLAVALTASLFSVGLMNRAHAQATANGLDPTFGADGIVTTNFSNHPHSYYRQSDDSASDVVIQPDGKIVVVGSTFPVSPGGDFAVVRYNKDGNLDQTFASDGKQTIDFFHGSSDVGSAVALQPDGKIVVVGSHSYFLQDPYVYGSDFALARLTSDGRPDRTFGSTGRVVTNFSGGHDGAVDVAIQADGKLVVAGTISGLDYRNYRFVLARYNRDGSLDDGSASDTTPSDSFGNGGKITNDFGGDAMASALVIQSDGKIVVAGTAYYPNYYDYPYHSDFALARYNPDGQLDTTFGNGGQQITEFPNSASNYSSITGLALQPDGKIVAVGNSNEGFTLARYNTDGQLDTSFDGDGKQTTYITDGVAEDVIILPDGKIVVAGHIPRNLIHVFMSPPSRDDFALARYHSDGSLDATFDDDGTLVTDLFCGFESARAIAAQPDGKLVVAGSHSKRFNDIVVVRYPVDPVSSAPRLLQMKMRHEFIGGTFVVPPVLGGRSTSGTVELCTQAPSDTVITLSDNLVAAQVQPSMTIPAGKYASTFTIKTTPVNELEIGTLTASLVTNTKSIPLRVRPFRLSSLTLSADHVQGTRSVTGIVTLERPAPPGGIVVTLSSSDRPTAYPTLNQLTIAPGTTRRSFTIRTNHVPYTRQVIIRATVNGITEGAMLTVQ